MKSELIMDPSSTTTTPNTWNPYNTLPTKTVSSSSLNGYSTSSSPLDNGSNNTSSSSDSGVDNKAVISPSLIPENGEINKSDERFFASNQNQTSVVNATSNSDGTSTASSDLSSLSASSSPPYRFLSISLIK